MLIGFPLADVRASKGLTSRENEVQNSGGVKTLKIYSGLQHELGNPDRPYSFKPPVHILVPTEQI